MKRSICQISVGVVCLVVLYFFGLGVMHMIDANKESPPDPCLDAYNTCEVGCFDHHKNDRDDDLYRLCVRDPCEKVFEACSSSK